MTDALPIRIKNYDDLVEAFRARKEQLGLADTVLDDAAGLTAGHVGKVLGPSRTKGIGALTLEALMMALAVDLIMVSSPAKLALMQDHYERRSDRKIHKRAYRLSRTAMARAKAQVFREFGSRGGKARKVALTDERRSEIARNAALAMHRKRRRMVEAA